MPQTDCPLICACAVDSRLNVVYFEINLSEECLKSCLRFVLILLCRYQFNQSPSPWVPWGFFTEMCAQPQGFCTAENVQEGDGHVTHDVPGAGHLRQLTCKYENCQHSHLGLKSRLPECCGGSGKAQKTQNTKSNCLFALSL